MMLNIIVSLFYFSIFVGTAVFFVRRSLPALEAADEAERKNYKQLVGHRASLKQELDKEHLHTHQLWFVQEHLLVILEQWKHNVEKDRLQKEEERRILYQSLLLKEEQKMAIVAYENLKKQILPEIFQQAQEQLVLEFTKDVQAGNAYIDRVFISMRKVST